MSQPKKPSALPLGGEGDEWAVGMPAYWLAQVQGEEADLIRFYHVKPRAAQPDDQQLLGRVGGTEQAAQAVVAFVLRYAQSMGMGLKTERSIRIVQERFVRAWELAGRPGAA